MSDKLTAANISLIYLAVAGLWIAFTDSILNSLISDPQLLTTIQTYKGLAYVVITTAVLYLLIRKHDQQIARKKDKIREQKQKHRAEQELLEKLFEYIPVMINSYNPSKDEFHINNEFERVTGWSSDDVDLTQACFPDPELRAEVKAFMDEPHSGWREFPMTTKSGDQVPTLWTNIHLEDDTLVGIGLDITERKKTEQTLRFQQQKLERAQELAGLGYWELDLKTDELTWSDGLYNMHNLDPDQQSASTEKFMNFVHPDDIDKFNDFIPKIIEHGKVEFIFRTRSANNDIGYFFTSCELMTNEAGEQVKVFGTVIDVTEVKKSELNARKSERLVRKTFDSLQSSIFVVEPGTRTITDCNKHSTEMFGYSKQELIGSSSRILHVDEEHYQQFDKLGEKGLKENGVFNTEFKMKRKDGEIFHSDHTVSLVFDENGEVERVVSVVRNITEQKQYELNLRKSKERLQRSQQVGQLGDWEYDPDSGDISWTPMMYEIYGRDPELGPPSLEELEEKYYPEDFELHHSKVRNAIRNATSYDFDLKLKTDDSKDKYIRAIGIPVQDETGNVTKLLGTVQDITERKRAERRSLTSLIEGEERERKRIAKELHDGLGQYLSASNMNFEAIKGDMNTLPDKRVQQFRTGLSLLRDAIEETRNIAHNLMPTAIEDYGLELAVVALIDKLQQATSIQFTFKSNLEEVRLTQQAEINLYRVIQEALSNAIKYADCSKISLQLYNHDHILSCMIEDNGVGTTIDAAAENQGMGIQSMKTRVQALSGTIDFESTTGAGMTILVQLPLQPNIIQE